MACKRKRVVLSLDDQVKVLEQLDKGVSSKKLTQMYGIAKSTISGMKRRKPELMNFVSVLEREDCNSLRKSMKTATNKDLDVAIFKWYLQQRSMGNPISGPILCEKAKILSEKLGYSSFKASNGWLRNFRSRHCVRELELSDEKLSARDFIEKFEVVTESYDADCLYNADETGLFWKALPPQSGHEASEDRVTVLNCANSTGSHRIPLLMIGKSKRPKAFKNVKKLPVFYKSQTKAWMTAAIFLEWYDEIFIPEVIKRLDQIGKEGSKVLLIVDNAPTHLSEVLFGKGNGQFKTLVLPLKVTSLLQPMNQSVIQTMKRQYRRQLLRKLLIECVDEESVLVNHKKMDLKDCAYMVAEAWSLVKEGTLRRAWNKLKGILTDEERKVNESQGKELKGTGEAEDFVSLDEFKHLFVEIPGCSKVSAEDIEKWIVCDSTDAGFQFLNEDELIESVKEESDEEEEEHVVEVEADAGPSTSLAFAGLEIALKWMERQPECDHIQLLTVKRARDLAAQKRISSKKGEIYKTFKLGHFDESILNLNEPKFAFQPSKMQSTFIISFYSNSQ